MMAPALPQISYCAHQELMNRGISSKINQVAQNLHIQIPSMFPQLMHNTGLERFSQNYQAQQQLQTGLKTENLLNERNAARFITNGVISKGFVGEVLYPNTSCITPVVSNRT